VAAQLKRKPVRRIERSTQGELVLSLGYLGLYLTTEPARRSAVALPILIGLWSTKLYMAYLLASRWSRLPKSNRTAMIAFLIIA
jgi:hypothetical protein